MKGRLLTIEEIERIENSDKKFVLERKGFNNEIIATTNGLDWFDEDYEWIATKKCNGLINGDYKLYEYIEETKTYKIDEVIKMFRENDKLKFQFTFSDGVIWELKTVNSGITCTYGKGRDCEQSEPFTLYANELKKEWTLIEEPKEVTFLEAVQALSKGKKIICKDNDGNTRHEFIGRCGEMAMFKDVNGNILNCISVLSKWYVED